VLPGINDPLGYNLVTHIRKALNFANTTYAPANISFYPSGFTFYESSSLYNNGQNLVGLYNAIHDDDAINVYIVNGYLNGAIGQAIYPDPEFPVNNTLSIQAISFEGFTHVLAHELGHYFNLLHTFDGTSYLSHPEDNCNLRGDKICDTPQDVVSYEGCPNQFYDCDSGCNNSCSTTPCIVRDKAIAPPNNIRNIFQPDKKNVMSYYQNCNLDHFSPMQLQRVYAELTNNQYRTFLIQGPNPPALLLPAENAFVYRTVLSPTGGITNVSEFGSMPVQLSKTGTNPVTSTTPIQGGPYNVDKGIFLPQNIVAKIVPSRDGTGHLIPTNGVTSLDILLIQRHVLAIQELPKPYAWIAADVNNSGSISTIDQLIIQQLILNQIQSFSAVPSWRMVPTFALQDASFSTAFNANPFAASWNGLGYSGTNSYFKDFELNLTNPNLNQASTFSFQAIKSGDVNFTAVVNSANTFRSGGNLPELRSAEKYQLRSSDASCLEPGKTYTVAIAAQGNVLIYAYQAGLKFDPKVVKVSSVDRGEAKFFSLDNFNLGGLAKGELKTVWLDFEKNEKIRVNEKKSLFNLLVTPQEKVCKLSEVFQLQDETLENLFYDEDARLLDLDLTISAQELKKGDAANDLLLKVFPNPTHSEINFEVSVQAKTKVDILLRDSFGKSLTLSRTLETGTNKITLYEELRNLGSGIIYYSLSLGNKPYSGTFFKL
jgi:hypothetical protein